jgi:hypothetical protein
MGYPQQGPPQRGGGGGGNLFGPSPGIPLNPAERMAVMLIRIIAWLALLFVVISACIRGIFILTNIPPVDGFKVLLNATGELIGSIAGQLIWPAILFAVAVLIENLVAWRNKA